MTCLFSQTLELVSWHFKDSISLCTLFPEKEFKITIPFHIPKRHQDTEWFFRTVSRRSHQRRNNK